MSSVREAVGLTHGIGPAREDGLGLGDRGLGFREPVGKIGCPRVFDVGQDFQHAEQSLEVVRLASDRFRELRGNRQRGPAVGGVHSLPDAGYVGFARIVHVRLFVRPAIVLDGESARFNERIGLVGAMPIDREMIGGFDGECGHDGLQKCEGPACGRLQAIAWRRPGVRTERKIGKEAGRPKPPRSIASFGGDGVWLRFVGFPGVLIVAGEELR